MKTLITLSFIFAFAIVNPILASRSKETELLRKEIERIAQKGNLNMTSQDNQEFTVHFLINAHQQLVVFDITGDNEKACARVKEALNYKQIRYKQARQLTPYEISIRFVNP